MITDLYVGLKVKAAPGAGDQRPAGTVVEIRLGEDGRNYVGVVWQDGFAHLGYLWSPSMLVRAEG